MADVLKRSVAKSFGLRFYFTGKACPCGHISERYVSDKSCAECRIEKSKTSEAIEAARTRTRDWYTKNKERHKSTGYKWRENNKEKYLAGIRENRRKNLEVVREKERAYRRANKDKAALGMARWRKKNPEKHAQHYRYYGVIQAALKRGASGLFSRDELHAIIDKQHGKCVYCSKKLEKYHFDHIMPIALGGQNNIENIQVLCPSCNCRKGKIHPEHFSAMMRAQNA